MNTCCLKWSNHINAIRELLFRYWQNKILIDVTLVCQEYGKTLFLEAHQMILSASSPFFETLFLQNEQPHPVVYLKDVKYNELHDILMFIYSGEVNVEQHRIKDVLETAKILRVRGLTTDIEVANKSADKPSSVSSGSLTITQQYLPKNCKENITQINELSEHPLSIKVNSPEIDNPVIFKYNQHPSVNSHVVDNVSPHNERPALVNSHIENSASQQKCLINRKRKITPFRGNVFSPHPSLPGKSVCNLCCKVVKSRWHHFQTHFSRNHECPFCGTMYSRVDTLKGHARRKHGREITKLSS